MGTASDARGSATDDDDLHDEVSGVFGFAESQEASGTGSAGSFPAALVLFAPAEESRAAGDG
jgi:hypothetical protein